jgi:hypothetical protein
VEEVMEADLPQQQEDSSQQVVEEVTEADLPQEYPTPRLEEPTPRVEEVHDEDLLQDNDNSTEDIGHEDQEMEDAPALDESPYFFRRKRRWGPRS